MIDLFDQAGLPITLEEWSALFALDEYRVVGYTKLGRVEVSTVWLGIDNGFGMRPQPLIFETMIFGGTLDLDVYRYPTKLEALAGHEHAVKLVELERALR